MGIALAFTPTKPHLTLTDTDLASVYTYTVPTDNSVSILRIQANGGAVRTLTTNAAQTVAPTTTLGFLLADGAGPSEINVKPGDAVRFIEVATGTTLEIAAGTFG